MYRDIITALRNGTAPPSDMAPYVEEAEKEKSEAVARMSALRGGGGGGSSSRLGGGGSHMSSSGSSKSMGGGGGSSSGGGGGDGDETPLARDARLKAEAKERLRAKFGDGGLKSQSAGYGAEGDAGDGGDDDFFNVDAWSARCVPLQR